MSRKFLALPAVRFGATLAETLARSSALTAIAVFSSALFAFTVLAYGQDVVLGIARHGLGTGLALASIAMVIVCTALALLIRRGRAFPPSIFLPAAVATSIVVYGIYAHSVDAPWLSDFQRMWIAVGRLVEQGRFEADGIIHQRTLPILWPAVYLFGHTPILVPIVNALLLVLILLIGYDVLRRTQSHLAAQIFAILWIAAAEPLYALKIPTHDLWGLFFAALTLWSLILVTEKRYGSAARQVGLGAWVGLPVILLEVQRELGLVALVALGTAALILAVRQRSDEPKGDRHRFRFACLFAGAAMAFLVGTMALKSVGVLTTDPSFAYLSNVRTAALAPGYSDGTFRYAQAFGTAFLRPQQPEAQRETAKALLLSDFSEQPIARISGAAFKTSRLALLGSQHGFYYNELNLSSPKLSETLTSYNKLYALLIAALFLAALPAALRSPSSLTQAFSLAFLGVLIGGLVTVGEVQPRYAFPVWLFAPLVIASHLGGGRASIATLSGAPSLARELVVGSATILLVVFAAWFVADRSYTSQDGRVATGFSITGEGVQPVQGVPPRQLDQKVRNNRSIGIGDLGFTLGASGVTSGRSRIVATREICADADRTSLRFGYVMPYDNPKAAGAFELRVIMNDTLVWSRMLPDGGDFNDVMVSSVLAPGACGTLQFMLVSTRALPRASWVNASLTEIYFPRLAREIPPPN